MNGRIISGTSAIAHLMKNNVFNSNYEKSIKSGKLLAKMLANENIFSYHRINFIGFSLGTRVIFECLKELETLKCANIVNDVVLMGGVVDIHDARTFEWNCVAGRIVNCYCLNDSILKYILQLAKFGREPIGLHKISEGGSARVEDFDLTHIVNGHLDYRKKMDKILDIIDLFSPNQSLKIIENNL